MKYESEIWKVKTENEIQKSNSENENPILKMNSEFENRKQKLKTENEIWIPKTKFEIPQVYDQCQHN